eukprot:CAMPEP_0180597930 /NCGR_PEP_ID=MMETSP1037_2-20121125/22595_1 /TAXON_ID=632150 /ORGANISM="Azadinium spinosum, Strain 3D9" /LENGTH=68 /DNA_ID=CAMNT_0022616507 /DNA_START=367 /DNA_END=569 /DNA_ORIENTATION=+
MSKASSANLSASSSSPRCKWNCAILCNSCATKRRSPIASKVANASCAARFHSCPRSSKTSAEAKASNA